MYETQKAQPEQHSISVAEAPIHEAENTRSEDMERKGKQIWPNRTGLSAADKKLMAACIKDAQRQLESGFPLGVDAHYPALRTLTHALVSSGFYETPLDAGYDAYTIVFRAGALWAERTTQQIPVH